MLISRVGNYSDVKFRLRCGEFTKVNTYGGSCTTFRSGWSRSLVCRGAFFLVNCDWQLKDNSIWISSSLIHY